jgi:hypothetical protein
VVIPYTCDTIRHTGGVSVEKVYLGDSVYAVFDGWGFILTTENGYPTDPSNRIYLEPLVLNSLNKYAEEVYHSIKEDKNAIRETQSEDQTVRGHAGNSTSE